MKLAQQQGRRALAAKAGFRAGGRFIGSLQVGFGAADAFMQSGARAMGMSSQDELELGAELWGRTAIIFASSVLAQRLLCPRIPLTLDYSSSAAFLGGMQLAVLGIVASNRVLGLQ